MKLYRCDIMDDCEDETILVIANNKDEAMTKVSSMDWSCLISIYIYEINEIDGYKIIVE